MPENNTEEYTGRYTRAFLNCVFGENKYTVRTFQLGELSDSIGMEAALNAVNDPNLSFAYMSDVKLTCVWLHEYPGWLKFCEPLGIKIKPSPKIAKRLTVMTRTAYLHKYSDISEVHFGAHPNPERINIRSVEPDEFSDYDVGEVIDGRTVTESDAEKFLDGANVISRELVEQMMSVGTEVVEKIFSRTGRNINPHDREIYNNAIDESGSVSLRITTPNGLIKGDALISTREKMGGYDVLYCTENIKKELRTEQFVFFLAEPHPGHRRHVFSPDEKAPPPVWSDDQSMSWLGDWLYPHSQLKFALKDFADRGEKELIENQYPSFFTSIGKLDDPYSTIQQFQAQAIIWERHGPGRAKGGKNARGTSLDQSIFLQERISQGLINMLSKKRRWPIICAAYVHVATDSWLHMAGYSDADNHPWPGAEPITPRGTAWIHEETGRIIYNDLDFADLYERHGGWDLDDSVRVHYRTYQGRKVLVIVRSPNSWGEYDIKDYIPGTFHSKWTTTEGEVIEFPPVGDGPRPEYLEELDITYKYESLDPDTIGANDNPHSLHGDEYTRDQVAHATETALEFKGVFGSRVNADIVYYHTVKDYRRDQLAPIEAMVDACTQEQSTKARELIEKDTAVVKREIIQSGKTADRTLWEQRLHTFDRDMIYDNLDWTSLTSVHKELCSLYTKRLFELAQRTAEIIDPDIMDLGRRNIKNGQVLVNWYYRLMRELPRIKVTEESGEERDENQTEFCQRVNDIMVARLADLEEHTIYNNVLAMARHCYTTRRGNVYKDTPLFQMGSQNRRSIFGYYLDAIDFYGIGLGDRWSAVATCNSCNSQVTFHDRVDYQAMLVRDKCSRC